MNILIEVIVMDIVDIKDSRVDYSIKRVMLNDNEIFIHCPYCKNPVWRSKYIENVVYCVKCKIRFEIVRKEVK